VSPDERTLAIVEVRSTAQLNKRPERTVGRAKRAAMLRIATQLRSKAKQSKCTLRVDLITVRFVGKTPEIDHFEGVLPLGKSRSFS
jgi:Holliday junction resolvase-like predicted endonuclease